MDTINNWSAESLSHSSRIDHQHIRPFILAGRAVFTLRSTRTGTRFTYRVAKKRGDNADSDSDLWWVLVLTGPDNTSNYEFIGFIRDNKFHYSRRSRISETVPSVLAISWFLGRLFAGKDFPDLEIWHQGRCGRCGRVLTVPESISSGFGPECAGRVAATEGAVEGRYRGPAAPKYNDAKMDGG